MSPVIARPTIDMGKSIRDRSHVLAGAATAYMNRNKTSIQDIVSMLIFAVLELPEVHEELEAKVTVAMADTFGCDVINTPSQELANLLEEGEELDDLLEGVDIDDEPISATPYAQADLEDDNNDPDDE